MDKLLSRFGLALAGLVLPMLSPLNAAPQSTDPAMKFAACAGRLSAQMEHYWITDPSASDRPRLARARMIELVDAAMRPGTGHTVFARRMEAKAAQMRLLTRARDPGHPDQARRAARLALQHVEACEALLLS